MPSAATRRPKCAPIHTLITDGIVESTPSGSYMWVKHQLGACGFHSQPLGAQCPGCCGEHVEHSGSRFDIHTPRCSCPNRRRSKYDDAEHSGVATAPRTSHAIV